MESIRAGKRLKPVVVKEKAGRSQDSKDSLMEQLMASLLTRRTNMGILGYDQVSDNTSWENEEE